MGAQQTALPYDHVNLLRYDGNAPSLDIYEHAIILP